MPMTSRYAQSLPGTSRTVALSVPRHSVCEYFFKLALRTVFGMIVSSCHVLFKNTLKKINNQKCHDQFNTQKIIFFTTDKHIMNIQKFNNYCLMYYDFFKLYHVLFSHQAMSLPDKMNTADIK